MTDEYENAVFSRENGIYHFSKYPPEEAFALKQREDEEKMQKAKAKEAALAAKKTAAEKRDKLRFFRDKSASSPA